jgi:putative ABC transport system substrate-binding protein
MDRRKFLGTIAGSLLAAPLAAEAQPAGKVYRFGVLRPGSPQPHLVKALEDGLRELGYVEGRNFVFEYRSAAGEVGRFPELAAELVRAKPDIIIPLSTAAAIAVKQATTTIPIVMVSPAEPVAAGLVHSLARPDGNLTGLTLEITPEISAKQLQLLAEVVPKLQRVAVLANRAYAPNVARWDELRRAAPNLEVALVSAEVRATGGIEGAFTTMKREGARGLLVLGDPLVFLLRRRIAELAVKNRLPSVSPYREGADAGGLIAYGPNSSDTYRRIGAYIDKILKGARPGDLPIEQPTKFELVINLKTAKALGLTIPPPLLQRADQVIE